MWYRRNFSELLKQNFLVFKGEKVGHDMWHYNANLQMGSSQLQRKRTEQKT